MTQFFKSTALAPLTTDLAPQRSPRGLSELSAISICADAKSLDGYLKLWHGKNSSKIPPALWRAGVAPLAAYWQVVNLNDDMCVLQLKLPVVL